MAYFAVTCCETWGNDDCISLKNGQIAGKYALDIERTLSSLDKRAIKMVRRQIKNLPEVLSSLTHSRNKDILLGSLDSGLHTETGPT